MSDRKIGGTQSNRDIVVLSTDLAAVAGLLVLADLFVLVPVLNDTPLRVALGLPLVLVLPGYAVIAALFPAHGPAVETLDAKEFGSGTSEGTRGIDGIERAALSVALSIPVVALTGLGLSLTPLGVTLVPMLVALNVLTLCMLAIAARRRAQLPESDRFRVPYRNWFRATRDAFRQPDGRTDLVLNIVLAVSILLAVGSVTYAVGAPNQGEAFTEFYLLTENETGALIADDYPTEFTVGESKPIIVGIESHEHETARYTVVARLQRTQIEGNTTTVVETERLDRFTVELGSNETWLRERMITPTMTGERLRVVYLLYRGAPPDEPSVANAYREVHLWVTVRA